VTILDRSKVIAVDTTANAVTLTLPSTGQTVGDTYSFLDAKANWGTTPATLASAVFFGTTQVLTLDMSGELAAVTWRGLPIGWTVGSGSVAVDNTALNTLFSSRAAVASPALTGVPTAPTAAAGNNTTQVATTAFVQAVAALQAPLSQSMTAGTWYPCASITRLLLNGTGTVTLDAMDSVGAITTGVYTTTLTSAVILIDWLYPGATAVKIRATLTSTATVTSLL
jgi:hypothetical protein